MIRHLLFMLVSFSFGSLWCGELHAQGTLRFESDDVLVYSGPGQKFRPIGKGKTGTKTTVNPQILAGPDGDYFEIVFSDKAEGESEDDDEKRLGYVSTRSKVVFERTGMDEGDDLKKYKSWAQAESAIQSDITILKDQSYLWTVGYLKYPSPGFFVKGFVGQILSRFSSSTILGGEVGLDQWIRGHFTAYSSFAVAPLFVPSDGTLFTGSQLFNLFVRGSVGLRYNADEHAQISFGLTQILATNVQNSFMSPGFALTLEVGL
ncbi:MAG: hypothetical protein K2X47_15115 [Bdellovibrionales bacterium]|nr:hypothetical protein [Bdellovibrionales bacterium]